MLNPVAVLLAVYKGDSSNYFELALNSIFSQEFSRPIHVYLVIDGPIAKELENCIEKFREKIFKIVRLSQNKGLAGALNAGIAALEDEEFVFRMDADDECTHQRFSQQISCFLENPLIGICGTAIKEFAENGYANIRKYPSTHQCVINSIHKGTPVAHPTVCFRRSALNILEKYPENYNLCEDIALWFEAIGKGVKFGNIEYVGLNYRMQNNFATRRSLTKAWNEFKIYQKGIYQIFGISWKAILPFGRLMARMLPASMIGTLYRSSFRKRLFR